MPDALVLTAGCRLNQSESDMLRARLRAQGMRLVDKGVRADRCYVNTCSVTGAADRSSVQLIRRACRQNPKPYVVVMGCLAQRDPVRLRAMPGVDEVWDQDRKDAELVGFGPEPRRSRAMLKVQDGCDRECGYCVVASLRGRPRSVRVCEVLTRFDRLLGDGFEEVVLTGLNLGLYQSEGTDLAGLVNRLLERPGRFRLRVGSLEPDTIGQRLLEVLSHPQVCPHLHLPLQSGDDAILAAMGRRYRTIDFTRLVEQTRAVRPDVNIGVDLIAGLPGETEASYRLTRSFVDSIRPGYLHVFGFSARPGTRARTMAGQVRPEEKRQRVKALGALSGQLRTDYERRFDGQSRAAVVEPDGWALTDNYMRVRLARGCSRAAGLEPGKLAMLSLRYSAGAPRGCRSALDATVACL